ncbi:hypothetical protein V1478_007050 [Vespula squamosa]|uniref:Uncharacterized protein n=1 Tax=Vespula squamosa TaxID=30214 RepID=A0ABD2B229_VESSQ
MTIKNVKSSISDTILNSSVEIYYPRSVQEEEQKEEEENEEEELEERKEKEEEEEEEEEEFSSSSICRARRAMATEARHEKKKKELFLEPSRNKMGNSKNEKNSRAASRKTAIEDSSEFPRDIFHGMSEYERTEPSVEPQTTASDECLTWANTAASAAATTTPEAAVAAATATAAAAAAAAPVAGCAYIRGVAF